MLFPECPHNDHAIQLCDSGPHYAKKVCKGCGKFRGWVVRPENQLLRAAVLAKVNELWNGSPTPWEREFLQSVADADGRMSPKQEGLLNGMWARRIVAAEVANWPSK